MFTIRHIVILANYFAKMLFFLSNITNMQYTTDRKEKQARMVI